MRIKLTSVISLLMATVLVLGALFTSCAPEKKGSQVVEYLTKILEATFADLETAEIPTTTSKLTFNNTADLGIPHLLSANLSVMTGKNGETASSAEVILDNGKADFSVYNVGTSVIVGSSVLGASKYGFELTDMPSIIGIFSSFFMPTQPAPEQNVNGNNTANNGATAPESSATGLGNLFGSLAGINSLLDGNNPEKVYGLLEKYVKIVSDAAEGACRSNIETGDAVKVTVEFNTDSAKKLIKDIFASLKKNKDLKSIVEGVLVTSGMTKDEAKAQIDAIFSDEMARSLYDMLDAAPFEFKAVVGATSEYILNEISVEYKSQGTTFKLFYDATEEGKVALGYTTSVSVEGSFHREENKIEFVTKTFDGAEIFEVNRISIIDNNAHAEPIFKTETKDGNYSVTIRVPDDVEGPYDMTVSGTIEETENKSTLTLTSATAFGNTLSVDLTVVTEIGGTLPEFPTSFKNLLDVTADEFKAIENNIKNSPLGQFMTGKEAGDIVLPDVE